MRARYLFPYKTRYIGLALILLHIPVKLLWDRVNPGHHHDPQGSTGLLTPDHLFFVGTTLMVLIGLFLIAFSREKIEDERVIQLRMDSLQWAIYFNYLILIVSLLFTNGIDAADMLHLFLWVPLVFFIVRFRWVIFRHNRSSN